MFALRLFSAWFLLLCACPRVFAEPVEETWDAAHTWVFAVGICHWKDAKSLASFPTKGRLEPELVTAFEKRGVPEEQVVYLEDSKATLAHIQKALVNQLRQTERGDTFIFYFSGHGYWDSKDGEHYFACFDCDDDHNWSVSSLLTTIDREFHGRRALLLGDCCGSGALVTAARNHRSRVEYGAIASSFRNNSSTGSWTFTDCLLKGLRGDPAVDLDGDGVVTLSECARFAEDEMAFIEEQRSLVYLGDAFSADCPLSRAHGEHDPARGEHVEAKFTDGEWYKAEVLEKRGSKVNVRYVDDNTTGWVTAGEVHRWKPPAHYDVGDHVLAQPEDDDEATWRPAIVKQTFDGLPFVHFENARGYEDQWVAFDQIKAR